jgi:hypothetical protein
MNATRTALSDPIEAKLAWAAEQRHSRPDLAHDPQTARLRDRLRDAARESGRAMTAAGIVDLCRSCERDEGGSCCGAGLEDRYDGVMLLINLLLGVELPASRAIPGSCYFLGRQGCTLIARDVICVNFLCQKIDGQIPRERIAAMREREGEELEILFAIHSRISHLIGEATDG